VRKGPKKNKRLRGRNFGTNIMKKSESKSKSTLEIVGVIRSFAQSKDVISKHSPFGVIA
jgi:hypothetical protein